MVVETILSFWGLQGRHAKNLRVIRMQSWKFKDTHPKWNLWVPAKYKAIFIGVITLPKSNMEPKSDGLAKGISYPGSMLNFRRVTILVSEMVLLTSSNNQLHPPHPFLPQRNMSAFTSDKTTLQRVKTPLQSTKNLPRKLTTHGPRGPHGWLKIRLKVLRTYML